MTSQTFRPRKQNTAPHLRRYWQLACMGLVLTLAAGCGEGGGSDGAGSLTPAGLNSASLSWSAPTTTVDGSPLTALAGYQVFYGQTTPLTAGNSQSAVINNANQTSYVLANLDQGTYYFAVTSFDGFGNQSPMSGEVSKTFQ